MEVFADFVLLHEHARLPTRATERAAGLDCYYPGPEPLSIKPGQRLKIPLGISVQVPPGHEGQMRPRSGLTDRTGLLVVLGTIDEDYRGELGVQVIHTGTFPITIAPHDRIAQLVIAPVAYATPRAVKRISSTQRGTSGFGSTGR